MTTFTDVGFSDIQRSEAIAICQLLVSAGRADMIVSALRLGLTLDDVREQLAAKATPAAPAAGTAPAPSANVSQTINRRTDIDAHAALEQASQERFAAMRRTYPPWG